MSGTQVLLEIKQVFRSKFDIFHRFLTYEVTVSGPGEPVGWVKLKSLTVYLVTIVLYVTTLWFVLLTFVFLQSFLSGLKHRFMELLSKFLWGEAVPGFGASIDAVKALFSLQGEWGPQAVQ